LIPGAAHAAINAHCSMADLGGNEEVTRQVLALDDAAKRARVTLVPDVGVAPGLAATITAHLLARFEAPRAVRLRCGGLPQDRDSPLGYRLSFSAEGLVNEYSGESDALRGGQHVRVPTLTELETIDLPPPFGPCEAFVTAGVTSTLCETYAGRVQELDYKTIRYPGHCAKFKTMIDLGLCGSTPIGVDGASVKPRRVLGELLVRNLPHDEPDVVLVRVELAGGGRTLRYDIVDRYDPETGLSAMMRTTAFPASIVALMMARNETTSKGSLPQERCLPPRLFMDELAKRKIIVGVESFEGATS
jgi:lysine 6-dehydrogenase